MDPTIQQLLNIIQGISDNSQVVPQSGIAPQVQLQPQAVHPLAHPQAAHAAAAAIQNGANPAAVDQAARSLGENDFIGLCEKFVEKVTKGTTGLYASAIDAWNKQQNRQTDMSKIQPGDAVYFAADNSNGGYGHTGVYKGNNQFIGATYNGIQQHDLNEWQKSTGQKVLGFIPSSRNVQPAPKPATVKPVRGTNG